MSIRLRARNAMYATCMTLALAGGGHAHGADIPVINGERWTKSSEAEKKAYLVGLSNLVQVQTAYQGANPPSDVQSFIPRLSKGMQGQTLDGVRSTIDRWYAANPTQIKRPVLDIIWFELAVPGLQKK